jgi:hypothetical protein
MLRQEYIIGLFCLIFSSIILITTRSFPAGVEGAGYLAGPSFYPNLLAIIFTLCGIYEISKGIKKQLGTGSTDPVLHLKSIMAPGPLNIILIIISNLFFIFFMERVGFHISSFIITFALMWRFGVSIVKNIIYSSIFLFLLFIIFGRLFRISLPYGLLELVGF